MDEDVAPTHFLQKDTLSRVVKKVGVVRGCVPSRPQNETQNIMQDYISPPYIPKVTIPIPITKVNPLDNATHPTP